MTQRLDDLAKLVDRILADGLPVGLREAIDAAVAEGGTIAAIKAAARRANAGPLLLAGVEVYAIEATARVKGGGG